MERLISQEERIRRAEEIYQRRKMINGSDVRVSSNSVNSNKTKISLFKKMVLQLAICSIIYIIFYFIKNSNYIFSKDVITKTKELLSHDINFENAYSKVVVFWEENKDKFKLPSIVENEHINEIEQDDINNSEESNIIENINEEENTNEILENNNQDHFTTASNEITENITDKEITNTEKGGIGGADTKEIEEKTNAETKKTQMEIDAEYVKEKCSFIIPSKGTVTSRYGPREATEIVSAYHYGIDIGNNIGTAIYASMEGTVTVVSSEGDYRKTYRNYK